MTALITGGTGFIGKHLIDRLLKRNRPITLLVRASSLDSIKRIIHARWFAKEHLITLLEGDITLPFAGLSDTQRDALKNNITDLFHLAAIYDMNVDPLAATTANVDGTANIIALANSIGCTLHHVSSIAVTGGEYEGLFREDMFEFGQTLSHPYYQTKYAAEALVRNTAHVPFRIYRPGAVVGVSTTGEMDKIDGPYYMFSLLRMMRGMLPRFMPLFWLNAGKLNLVPVDYVADAIDALAHQSGLDGQTFHLVESNAPSLLETIQIFAKAANMANPVIGIPEAWSFRLLDLSDSLAQKAPYGAAVRQGFFDKMNIPASTLDVFHWKTGFDTTNTDAILKPLGIQCPPLQDYAPALWNYWEQHMIKRRHPRNSRERAPWTSDLKGKRVLITGASSGIGKALALVVARLGGIVLMVARSQDKLDEVKIQIEKAGGTAFSYTCDLTSDDAVAVLLAHLDQEPPIDILVNNAGRSIRRSLSNSYDRFHDFERTMQLNYFGSLRITLGLLKRMRAQRKGHIVHISSVGVPVNTPRFAAYVASKAAFDEFCRVAAAESYSDNVHFSTIYMPLVRTPMIAPTQQYASTPALTPEQAAALVVKTLQKRPARVMNGMARGMQLLRSLSPALAVKLLNLGYRYTPGSSGKKTESTALAPSTPTD